jgi:hypothetical protein
VGKDGWLYVGEDFERPCTPKRTVAEIFERLERLERLVTESGRRFVFTIAPDKSSMVPENLPGTVVGRDCAEARKREFWKQLPAGAPRGYFDLLAPLEREEERDPEPLYRRIDSHWGGRGAAVYAEQLANALEPSLWDGTEVRRAGTARGSGDLADLLGDRGRQEERTIWRVVRPGVVGNFDEVGQSNDPVHVMNETTGVALFGPRTTLAGDSFTDSSKREVYSLFADVVRVNNERTQPEVLAREIAAAEVVILQIAERNIASGWSSIISDEMLTLIESELASAPR